MLIAAGVFAPERGVRAEEKAMDVKTDVRELSRQEVSLIAYEIPIEKLHTDITEQTETEAEPQTETNLTRQRARSRRKRQLRQKQQISQKVRIRQR